MREKYTTKLSDIVDAKALDAKVWEQLQKQFSKQSETTYAAIVVNRSVLKQTSSRDKIHAEEFIEEHWHSVIERVIRVSKDDPSMPVELTVTLNRTPCHARCAPLMARLAQTLSRSLANEGLNPQDLKLILAATGIYDPQGKKASDEEVEEFVQSYMTAVGTTEGQARKRAQEYDVKTGKGGATTLPDLSAMSAYWELRVLVVKEAPSAAGKQLLQALRRIAASDIET